MPIKRSDSPKVYKQARERIDPRNGSGYVAKKKTDIPPIRPITASAFTIELHRIARKTNGALKILDNCPTDIVELPDYFCSLKPTDVAYGFKACIAQVITDELDSRGLLGRSEAKGIVANLIRSLAIAQDKLIEVGCELHWAKPAKGKGAA